MMGKFAKATILKKANIYFGGRVTSRTVFLEDGSRKTLGIILPGDYEFDTAAKEVIEILDGELDVLLPDKPTWGNYTTGTWFDVAANSRFKLQARTVVDYCCSYEEK
jgi:hypothetical protein